MSGSNLTMIVLLFVSVLLIVYDFYAYWSFGQESTISMYLFDISKKFPIVPFGIGVIMGHLFWQNR